MLMKLKDPVSSITHYIGAILSFIFAFPLIYKGFEDSYIQGVTMVVYIFGMLALYNASGTYHAINSTQKINRILKKLDHCMIFVLIAASYTPVCLVVLGGFKGIVLLIVIWTIAFLGIIMKMILVYHPKWISSVLYIAMGWACIFSIVDIYNSLGFYGFLLLLFGGIFYTIGGVIYALKLKIFNSRKSLWGSHEIFHVFVMLGSVCHYLMMYYYIA